MNCATELTGTVRTVNGNGFKVDGREAWLNFSKFASLTMPAVGQRVRVGLDKSGYVRSVEVDEREPIETALPIRGASQESAQPAPSAPADKDRRITRLAVLNTATAILSTAGGAVAYDDVISVAEALEQWVTR